MPTRLDPPHSFFLIFLIQILATAMMTGIIWFVQIVHYPLFVKIPGKGFTAYERSHTVRTGWVVAPLMLVELGGAVTLLLFPRLIDCSGLPLVGDPLYLAALGCLILIWASTFLLQVPRSCKESGGIGPPCWFTRILDCCFACLQPTKLLPVPV